jgi:hypothetical protein
LFAPPFVMVLLALLLYIGLLSLFLLDVAWRCCIAKGRGHRADFGVRLRRWHFGKLSAETLSVRLIAHAEVRTARQLSLSKFSRTKAEGMHIEGLRFQYLARVLIAWATAISYTNSLCDYTKCKPG